MKAFLFFLVGCFLPVGGFAELKVGTAAVDITPTVTPFQLRSGSSSYVHDPLHVRAIAFENGKGRAAIAIIDAIGYGRERSDMAKAIVAEATGWKAEDMLVAATHTHSAPKGGDTSPGRIAYEELRYQGIIKALTQAIKSLEPAVVGFGSEDEDSEVYNRRWFIEPDENDLNPLGQIDKVRTNGPRQRLIRPAGPTDPELSVVYAKTKAGKPLGLLANYALHYVGGIPKVMDERGRERGMASADYFGEFARLMPNRLGGRKPPENFVAMMSNGSSGDINNIDFYGKRAPRAPYEQLKQVATKTADAAWRAVKKIDAFDDSPIIAVRQREVALKYRKPSKDEIEQAKKILALPKKERDAINKRSNNVAARTLAQAADDHPKGEKVWVQAIRIGDQAIVTMPFEVLVEIGLTLKHKSPFKHTFMIELANGGYGYLPPPHQFELGGYETWMGTSRFQVRASDILSEHLIEMLQELHDLQ